MKNVLTTLGSLVLICVGLLVFGSQMSLVKTFVISQGYFEPSVYFTDDDDAYIYGCGLSDTAFFVRANNAQGNRVSLTVCKPFLSQKYYFAK